MPEKERGSEVKEMIDREERKQPSIKKETKLSHEHDCALSEIKGIGLLLQSTVGGNG